MAGDGPYSGSKKLLPLPGVCTEEMPHAAVECRVKGKAADHRSDTGHFGTDHEAGYDSHKPAKSGFPGKAGTETLPICRNLCYAYRQDSIPAVCWFWIGQLNHNTLLSGMLSFFMRTFDCPVNNKRLVSFYNISN